MLRCLFAFALLLLSYTAYSQCEIEIPVEHSYHLGVWGQFIRSDGAAGRRLAQWDYGWSAGAMAHVYPQRRLSMLTEPGYRRVGRIAPGDSSVYYRQESFRLPVLLQVQVGTIYLQAGPYADYLLGMSRRTTPLHLLKQGTDAQPQPLSRPRTHVGLMGGIAFHSDRLRISVRYSYERNRKQRLDQALMLQTGFVIW
ncbi:hypothetical protein SAMN05421823_105143 [Catalinimonas alkaloidigena]|uniref:Outer membrane protein beta-barrel domain-containing protein n=1 Tax=Catalinimonas alkaloidigena TaxID=1075417 RepID=A0A1G9IYL6_9BACT|nr:PorT family protein [Catalinimonas alkaloidigena]SDL30043.1 hypothetical protein SAMN05421823_105143 [Catalinimonas alkaloidigena]